MDANERARRYRARQRGEDVPKLTAGVKPGYKQSDEHIANRILKGEQHPNWIGGAVSDKGGRARALRKFKDIGPCVLCGTADSERHHIDGDTANNDPTNILIVCRRCHMREDGRLEQFRQLAIANNVKRRRKPRSVQ